MAHLSGKSSPNIVPHRVGHTHRLVDRDGGGAAARYSKSVPAGQVQEGRRAEPGSPPGKAFRPRERCGYV